MPKYGITRNVKPGKANLNITVNKNASLVKKCCIILCDRKDTDKKGGKR
jgi:hypothetical protein